MKILALETSARAVSAAVSENGRILTSGYQDTGLTHSRTLMPIVEHILKNADLKPADMDAIAVAVGPGSFTGIRIGVAAAKGLALALDKPAIGVSTLAAMARNVAFADGLVVCAMDARRSQVYNATFSAEGGVLTRLTPPQKKAKNAKNVLTKAPLSAIINHAVGTAGVAQLVEQLICNQQVGGSNPSTSSKISYGGIPERPNGADCKSVVTDFGGSNPPSPTKERLLKSSRSFFAFANAEHVSNAPKPCEQIPPKDRHRPHLCLSFYAAAVVPFFPVRYGQLDCFSIKPPFSACPWTLHQTGFL